MSHDKAMTMFKEAGQRGGRERARRLSPERLREIAAEAGRSAAAKRRGGLSRREYVSRYLELLRERDAELAEFMYLSMQVPARFAPHMSKALSPAERALIVEMADLAADSATPKEGSQ
jgi:hypothetical protein